MDCYHEPKSSYVPLNYAEHGRNHDSTPERAPPLTHSDSAVKPALSSTTSGFLQATFIVLSRLVDHRGNVYGNEL